MAYFRVFLSLLFLFVQSLGFAGKKYDSGERTSVAKSGNIIVEVHQSEYFSRLWYKVGFLDEKKKLIWGKSIQYDQGVRPKVSLEDNTIVEVHQDHAKSVNYNDPVLLIYRVGIVNADSKTITWGNSIPFIADGLNPNIALNQNRLITSYRAPHFSHIEKQAYTNSEGKMMYSYIWHYYYTLKHLFGRLDRVAKKIDWSSSDEYMNESADWVAGASLASSRNIVVEVNQTSENHLLWSRVGTFTDNGVSWGDKELILRGSIPSLTMENNTVLEVHQCYGQPGHLCYLFGTINPTQNNILWESEKNYDTGLQPSIALNENKVVETHKSENFDSLYYNLACINFDQNEVNWKTNGYIP